MVCKQRHRKFQQLKCRPQVFRFWILASPEGDTSFDPLFVSASGLWMVVSLGPVAYALRIYLKLNCSFYKVGKNLQMAAVDML